MNTEIHELSKEDLVTLCEKQAQKITQLEADLLWLKEQVLLAKPRQFGASSEKTPEEQRALVFNEAEVEATPSVPEPTVETITYQRRKTKGQREAQLLGLPVECIDHRLSEEELPCPRCGKLRHELPGLCDVRQELVFEPAKAKVVRHIRYKYACDTCDDEVVDSPIETAPMPTPAFPNSLASPSAVAYIMSQKYVEGLPLYRQEQSLARLGITLSRQTLANWMLAGAEWLTPLYDRMHEVLLTRDILHADETTFQVLHEPGRKATTDSYLWLYRTGREGPPIVLYDYQPTRGHQHPKAFLQGFIGYLNVDGYIGYALVPNVILVGCWSHARRYFTDALTALPTSARNANMPTAAEEGLRFCNRLFALERDFHDVSAAARLLGREQYSRPVLNAFHLWLNNQQTSMLPKSSFGKAITYCLNQWDKLLVFLTDGRLELDNNRSERSIKPFVIGRKNWLFANTPKGATASAIIYSLIETAKENGLNPFTYLPHLFTQIPDCTTSQLDTLLPWSDNLPESCRVPVKPTP